MTNEMATDQMTPTHKLIYQAAQEAAVASHDAHGDFVPARDAYDFIKTMMEDGRYDSLPDEMPLDFILTYARFAEQIRRHNRFAATLGTR